MEKAAMRKLRRKKKKRKKKKKRSQVKAMKMIKERKKRKATMNRIMMRQMQKHNYLPLICSVAQNTKIKFSIIYSESACGMNYPAFLNLDSLLMALIVTICVGYYYQIRIIVNDCFFFHMNFSTTYEFWIKFSVVSISTNPTKIF